MKVVRRAAKIFPNYPQCCGNDRPQMNEISKPKHYTQGSVECLDAIDSMLVESSRVDFYRSQIIKYMWRLRDKGAPLKDAQKARFYLERLIEKLG